MSRALHSGWEHSRWWGTRLDSVSTRWLSQLPVCPYYVFLVRITLLVGRSGCKPHKTHLIAAVWHHASHDTRLFERKDSLLYSSPSFSENPRIYRGFYRGKNCINVNFSDFSEPIPWQIHIRWQWVETEYVWGTCVKWNPKYLNDWSSLARVDSI
jgi:hypothetical protein